MTTIHVTKNEEGKLVGCGQKDGKAYARFKSKLENLECGEIFTIDYFFPRNPKLHGLHFAMLTAIYDAQEQFADPDQMRMWLQVGAGHAEFVPGPKGRMVALPKSVSFRSIDDAEFAEHHQKVKDFLRSTYATRFLWPQLADEKASELVESILQEFEE